MLLEVSSLLSDQEYLKYLTVNLKVCHKLVMQLMAHHDMCLGALRLISTMMSVEALMKRPETLVTSIVHLETLLWKMSLEVHPAQMMSLEDLQICLETVLRLMMSVEALMKCPETLMTSIVVYLETLSWKMSLEVHPAQMMSLEDLQMCLEIAFSTRLQQLFDFLLFETSLLMIFLFLFSKQIRSCYIWLCIDIIHILT